MTDGQELELEGRGKRRRSAFIGHEKSRGVILMGEEEEEEEKEEECTFDSLEFGPTSSQTSFRCGLGRDELNEYHCSVRSAVTTSKVEGGRLLRRLQANDLMDFQDRL